MTTRSKSPSFTKSGPGRRTHTKSERAKHMKTLKQRSAGSYGRGLMNHFNRLISAASAARLQRRALR